MLQQRRPGGVLSCGGYERSALVDEVDSGGRFIVFFAAAESVKCWPGGEKKLKIEDLGFGGQVGCAIVRPTS